MEFVVQINNDNMPIDNFLREDHIQNAVHEELIRLGIDGSHVYVEEVISNLDTIVPIEPVANIITFDHTNHKRLWLWLSKNPNKNKENWPEWLSNGGNLKEVENNCFACEYDELLSKHNNYTVNTCSNCPLIWPNNDSTADTPCCGKNGIYEKWNETDTACRSDLALLIAELPIKNNIITK